MMTLESSLKSGRLASALSSAGGLHWVLMTTKSLVRAKPLADKKIAGLGIYMDSTQIQARARDGKYVILKSVNFKT